MAKSDEVPEKWQCHLHWSVYKPTFCSHLLGHAYVWSGGNLGAGAKSHDHSNSFLAIFSLILYVGLFAICSQQETETATKYV